MGRRYQCWHSDDCEGTAALEADERAQRAPRLLNHGVNLVAVFKAELHGRAQGVRRASLIFSANVAGRLGHTHRIRRVVVLDALISVYKAKSGPLKAPWRTSFACVGWCRNTEYQRFTALSLPAALPAVRTHP